MAHIIGLEDETVACAIRILRDNGIVVVPTETVYGLAADATKGEAVARIFEAKGRPQFNPLICHVSCVAMAEYYADINPLSRRLINTFWPGPLTLVMPLKANRGIHPLVTTGLETLALRMPCGITADIIEKLGRPLAAPSANISGKMSATTAKAITDDLKAKVDLIIDAGPCQIGLESTIVKVEDNALTLLRPGGLAAEEIVSVAKVALKKANQHARIEAPGMLVSHYAPRATLRLNVTEVHSGEALLAFDGLRTKGIDNVVHQLNLSKTGDLREAAANFFDYMAKLDRTGVATIAVEPIPWEGLGEAINDRLLRAAAPRVIGNGNDNEAGISQ